VINLLCQRYTSSLATGLAQAAIALHDAMAQFHPGGAIAALTSATTAVIAEAIHTLIGLMR